MNEKAVEAEAAAKTEASKTVALAPPGERVGAGTPAASAAGAPPAPIEMLPCRLTRTRGCGGGEGDAATVDATEAAGERGGERGGERAA